MLDSNEAAPPEPHDKPSGDRTVSDWLMEMRGWTEKAIFDIQLTDDAPITQKIAARQLELAASREQTKSGAPVSSSAFDKVMERTEGKVKTPEEAAAGVTVQIVNVSTQDILDKIDKLIDLGAGGGPDGGTSLPAPIQPAGDAVPADQPADRQGTEGESGDPA